MPEKKSHEHAIWRGVLAPGVPGVHNIPAACCEMRGCDLLGRLARMELLQAWLLSMFLLIQDTRR